MNNNISLDIKGKVHTDTGRMVKDCISDIGLSGQFSISLVTCMRGSSHTKGLRVKEDCISGVRVEVHPGSNDSRQLCILSHTGSSHQALRKQLLDGIGGDHWRGPAAIKKSKPNHVGPITAQEALNLGTIAQVTPDKAEPPESKQNGHLRGWSEDNTIVASVLNDIHEVYNGGDWSTEQFYDVIEKQSTERLTHHSMGQFLRRLVERGFVIESKVSRGGKHFHLTVAGIAMLPKKNGESGAVTSKENGTTQKSVQPDNPKTRIDDVSQDTLTQFRSMISLIENGRLAQEERGTIDERLKVLRKEIFELQTRAEELDRTLNDPKLVEAKILIEKIKAL